MQSSIKTSLALFFVLLSNLAHATFNGETLDNERGDHRIFTGGDFGEIMDMNNGRLRLRNLDISLPGNGGLNIEVYRSYDMQPRPGPFVPELMADWALEVPYIKGYRSARFGYNNTLIPANDRHKVSTWAQDYCAHPIFGPETSTISSNAWGGLTLLIPGRTPMEMRFAEQIVNGQKKVVVPQFYNDNFWPDVIKPLVKGIPAYRTENNWKAECIPVAGLGNNAGFKVVSPAGVKYTFNYFANPRGKTEYPDSWPADVYATKVEDIHGNALQYTYNTDPNGGAYVTEISASDGRRVVFNYNEYTPTQLEKSTDFHPQGNIKLLASIDVIDAMAGNQRYVYTYSSGKFLLTGVQYPGSFGSYVYTHRTEAPNSEGINSIKVPTGATATYAYGSISMITLSLKNPSGYSVPVVTGKSIAMDGQPAKAYSYSYALSGTGSIYLTTSVTSPDKKEQFVFYRGGSTDVKEGLLKTHKLFDVSSAFTGTPLQTTENEWQQLPTMIGTDGTSKWGETAYYRRLKTVTKTRGGWNFITALADYDDLGFSSKTTETGNAPYSRTTQTVYAHNRTNWILGALKSNVVTGNVSYQTLSQEFDPNTADVTSRTQNGITKSYEYTPQGDVAKIKWTQNSIPYQTEYTNYKCGKPQTERLPVGGYTISRVINDACTVKSETDANGNTTSYEYDANRIKRITPPLFAATTYSWNNPREQVMTRADYQETTYLDGLGRISKIKSADLTGGSAIYSQTQYDTLNRVVFQSQPMSSDVYTNGVKTAYDALNRVKTRAVIAGANTYTDTFTYPSGNSVRHTDARGYLTRSIYRIFGNPDERFLTDVSQEVRKPNPAVTSDKGEYIGTGITRDMFGKVTYLIQGVDSNGTISGIGRWLQYNDKQLLQTVIDPERSTVNFGYDEIGNRTTETIGTLGTTIYTYDALGRLGDINYPDSSPDVTNTYDGNGNILSIDNGVARREYRYNAMNNNTEESVTIDGRRFVLSTLYENAAKPYPTALIYPSGERIDVSSDAFGRTTQYGRYAKAISYYSNNQLAKFTYGSNQTANFTLEDRGWVKAANYSTTSGINNLSYAYDPSGNMISYSTPADSSTLGYDGVGRMIATTNSASTVGSGVIQYDALGNIASQTIEKQNNKYAYTYDQATNRLLKVVLNGATSYNFGYDGYGNVVDDGLSTFVYNAAGQLTRIAPRYSASQDVGYDGNNRRVRVTQTGQSIYTFYRGDQPFYEYDVATNQAREYHYLAGKLIANRVLLPSSEAVAYYATNALGSLIAEMDATGSPLWRGGYTAFGLPRGTTAAVTKLGYTGKPFDKETKLVYMGARYYSSLFGRFYGVDPVGFDESNPISFNRYAYANNNPYRYVDPDGNIPVDTIWDFGNVVYDLGKAGFGWATGNQALVIEGLSDASIDAFAMAVPYVPAGASKAARFGAGKVTQAAENFSEVATRTTRQGGSGVRITRNDGTVIDITEQRVKEFVPNTHPKAPIGALDKVKFDNALPGSKGYKRAPTREELQLLKDLDI